MPDSVLFEYNDVLGYLSSSKINSPGEYPKFLLWPPCAPCRVSRSRVPQSSKEVTVGPYRDFQILLFLWIGTVTPGRALLI